MARNEQLIRQHKILQILEDYRFGRTLGEIRDELVDALGLTSLHTRSVRRDLEALQAVGFDIGVHSIQRGKVWKLGSTARSSPKITAGATELIALSLGRDLLFPLAGTPFWTGIESFWKKLYDQLPASVADHFEKYRRVLYVLGTPAKSYAAKQGILKTVNRAILEHRVVQIEYHAPGRQPAGRLIEPYAIVFYQSSLYIIAAAHEIPAEEQRLRHWKLDRFLRATALDRWFRPDPEFNLDQYLGHNLGIFSRGTPRAFKIHISERAASWVLEDPWHPDQKVKRRGDGSIELTVQATHELEIIPKVLALGSEAELISPPSCRKTIADLVGRMAAMYAE